MIKFNSWSPSRLDDYGQCPRMAKHKHIQKLCGLCYKGTLRGKFGEAQICDACRRERVTPPAMARGGAIGKKLERYVKGEDRRLTEEILHPAVRRLASTLRSSFKKGSVKVEESITLDQNWKVVPEGQWGGWLYTKLDVRWQTAKDTVKVIDWKTGGINKDTGEVRAQGKYELQLAAYTLAAFALDPKVTKVEPSLVFVDCGPAFDPEISKPTITRDEIPEIKKFVMNFVKPMLSDTDFAERPGFYCRWCDYSTRLGGPCPH